jgi:hypothetical protein
LRNGSGGELPFAHCPSATKPNLVGSVSPGISRVHHTIVLEPGGTSIIRNTPSAVLTKF